jgi:hypothetical protein
MFFEGYISQDLDSENIFRGIGIFCRFFYHKDFLSYRPLKTVWADLPTAVRFRVNRVIHIVPPAFGNSLLMVTRIVPQNVELQNVKLRNAENTKRQITKRR